MDIEPMTTLQPSLHTIEEYCVLVLDELTPRGIKHNLWAEYRACSCLNGQPEFIPDIIDDALSLLSDAGYANMEADDTLIIMPKGVNLPEDWQE